MARVEFTFNSLSPTLKKLPHLLDRNFNQIMKFHEPKIRKEARHDAPWTDRTGSARQGLDARSLEPKPNVYQLVLFGKVEYQIWLEIRHSGKFANIMPTIRWYGPLVMKSFNKLLERMKIEAG